MKCMAALVRCRGHNSYSHEAKSTSLAPTLKDNGGRTEARSYVECVRYSFIPKVPYTTHHVPGDSERLLSTCAMSSQEGARMFPNVVFPLFREVHRPVVHRGKITRHAVVWHDPVGSRHGILCAPMCWLLRTTSFSPDATFCGSLSKDQRADNHSGLHELYSGRPAVSSRF
jgi:hypothetical protein